MINIFNLIAICNELTMEYRKLLNLIYVDQIYQYFWNNLDEISQELLNEFTLIICDYLGKNKSLYDHSNEELHIIKYNIAVWVTLHQKYEESTKMLQCLFNETTSNFLKIRIILLIYRNNKSLNIEFDNFKRLADNNLEICKNNLNDEQLRSICTDMTNLTM